MRRLLIPALALVAASVLFASEPSGDVGMWRGDTSEVDVDHRTVTVLATQDDDEGRSMTFSVDDTTRILKNGVEIDLSELDVGLPVTVNYRQEDDRMVAVVIGVQSGNT